MSVKKTIFRSLTLTVVASSLAFSSGCGAMGGRCGSPGQGKSWIRFGVHRCYTNSVACKAQGSCDTGNTEASDATQTAPVNPDSVSKANAKHPDPAVLATPVKQTTPPPTQLPVAPNTKSDSVVDPASIESEPFATMAVVESRPQPVGAERTANHVPNGWDVPQTPGRLPLLAPIDRMSVGEIPDAPQATEEMPEVSPVPTLNQPTLAQQEATSQPALPTPDGAANTEPFAVDSFSETAPPVKLPNGGLPNAAPQQTAQANATQQEAAQAEPAEEKSPRLASSSSLESVLNALERLSASAEPQDIRPLEAEPGIDAVTEHELTPDTRLRSLTETPALNSPLSSQVVQTGGDDSNRIVLRAKVVEPLIRPLPQDERTAAGRRQNPARPVNYSRGHDANPGKGFQLPTQSSPLPKTAPTTDAEAGIGVKTERQPPTIVLRAQPQASEVDPSATLAPFQQQPASNQLASPKLQAGERR